MFFIIVGIRRSCRFGVFFSKIFCRSGSGGVVIFIICRIIIVRSGFCIVVFGGVIICLGGGRVEMFSGILGVI